MADQGPDFGEQTYNVSSVPFNTVNIFYQSFNGAKLSRCTTERIETIKGIAALDLRYVSVPHAQMNSNVEDMASYSR